MEIIDATQIFPKLNRASYVNYLKAESTHSSKLHSGTSEQLHCFILRIEKPTSIARQVVVSTTKDRKKREIEKAHTIR